MTGCLISGRGCLIEGGGTGEHWEKSANSSWRLCILDCYWSAMSKPTRWRWRLIEQSSFPRHNAWFSSRLSQAWTLPIGQTWFLLNLFAYSFVPLAKGLLACRVQDVERHRVRCCFDKIDEAVNRSWRNWFSFSFSLLEWFSMWKKQNAMSVTETASGQFKIKSVSKNPCGGRV